MSLTTLTDYYASLLAYEYRGLPNASRQVKLWASQMTGEGLPELLLNCFDLDAAVGAQLDILGQYVGLARNIGLPVARPYFGLWTYAEPTLDPARYQGTWEPVSNTPDISPAGSIGDWWVTSAAGASTAPLADTFACGDVVLATSTIAFVRYTHAPVYPYGDNTPNGNGLTSYESTGINANGVFYSYDFASGQNSDLTDAQYRIAIKLKIILNSSDGTLASIAAYLWEAFGQTITVVDTQNMNLAYTVYSTVNLSPELLAIYLPRPMGVGISVTIISPTPGGIETLTTEDGLTLTTEDGDTLTTETT